MSTKQLKKDVYSSMHFTNGVYYIDASEFDHTCQSYASSSWRLSVDEYARRGQTDPANIRRQLFESKKSEFAVFYFSWYLLFEFDEDKNMICSPPDIRVLPVHEKCWDPDLRLIPINKRKQKRETRYLLVKQQNESKFSPSWMCQKIDKWIHSLRRDAFVALCTVMNDGLVRIDYATCLKNLTKKVFNKPKLPRLRKTKIAIYSELIDKYVDADCHMDFKEVFE